MTGKSFSYRVITAPKGNAFGVPVLGINRGDDRGMASGPSGEIMKLEITPYYGWGWSNAKGGVVTVPDRFELEAKVIEAGQPFYSVLGQLTAANHPLNGLWILLAQRHSLNDGLYNLWAFAEKPAIQITAAKFPMEPIITGFALAIEIDRTYTPAD
jgi:hypothetical protein